MAALPHCKTRLVIFEQKTVVYSSTDQDIDLYEYENENMNGFIIEIYTWKKSFTVYSIIWMPSVSEIASSKIFSLNVVEWKVYHLALSKISKYVQSFIIISWIRPIRQTTWYFDCRNRNNCTPPTFHWHVLNHCIGYYMGHSPLRIDIERNVVPKDQTKTFGDVMSITR